QRGRPRVRPADGRLLRRLRPRRGAGAWVYFRAGQGLGAPGEGRARAGEDEGMTAIIGQTRSPKHRIAYIPERFSGELKPFLKEGLMRAAILDSCIDPERVRS